MANSTSHDPPPSLAEPIATVIYLSGAQRGRTLKIEGTAHRIVQMADGEIRLMPVDQGGGFARLGTLHRSGDSYELVMDEGAEAWINAEASRRRQLSTGDVIEIKGGPVFRFCIDAPGGRVRKSVAEVFADCRDCAQRDSRSMWFKLPGLAAGMLHDLTTQTTLWFRGGVVGALLVLVGLSVVLVRQTSELEAHLVRDQGRIQVLADALRAGERDKLTQADLAAVRARIDQGLGQTDQRVTALEDRSAAVQRIIAEVSGSVVFIQGAYGFEHEESGRSLRVLTGPGGEPVRGRDGDMVLTLMGDGPPYRSAFTGTAFIVTAEGLLLTNRHVALPWELSEVGKTAASLGLKPRMVRMVGFVPDHAEPFDVKLVSASDQVDLAVLSCQEVTLLRTPLKLASAAPQAGHEVVVIGYPTGIRALLARAGDRFVADLQRRTDLDMLGATRELAKAGLIRPLASRGIVGQVTQDALAYDAETTQGGSGGPVLNLNGEVVAVNAAILPEFGGSNIGVPIMHAFPLIEKVVPGR